MTGPPRPPRPEKTALLVAQRILESIALQGSTVGDRLPPERALGENVCMTDHLGDYAAYVQAKYPGALSGANRWTRTD